MTVRNILMNPDSVAPQGAPSQVVVRSTVPSVGAPLSYYGVSEQIRRDGERIKREMEAAANLQQAAVHDWGAIRNPLGPSSQYKGPEYKLSKILEWSDVGEIIERECQTLAACRNIATPAEHDMRVAAQISRMSALVDTLKRSITRLEDESRITLGILEPVNYYAPVTKELGDVLVSLRPYLKQASTIPGVGTKTTAMIRTGSRYICPEECSVDADYDILVSVDITKWNEVRAVIAKHGFSGANPVEIGLPPDGANNRPDGKPHVFRSFWKHLPGNIDQGFVMLDLKLTCNPAFFRMTHKATEIAKRSCIRNKKDRDEFFNIIVNNNLTAIHECIPKALADEYPEQVDQMANELAQFDSISVSY